MLDVYITSQMLTGSQLAQNREGRNAGVQQEWEKYKKIDQK